MKAAIRLFLGLILIPLVAAFPAGSQPAISCGDVITASTTLDADLTCPPGAGWAINIGASNITLDLGGHTISGHTPGVGVLATDRDGIAIRNGAIEGFQEGVFLIECDRAMVEKLAIRNLDSSDPGVLVRGVAIDGSQQVVVRDALFEFLVAAHKEGVDAYASDVAVSDIEVRGGGAGVGFSYAGACDPLGAPNTGTVTNSRFTGIYIAGLYVACGSDIRLEGNNISTAPGAGVGIQAEAPFPDAVTGLTITGNAIHDTMIGVELRGIISSTVAGNNVFDHGIWGIAVRESLGCIDPQPGWDCFTSTADLIADNNTWGSGVDLYHHESVSGNSWTGNRCQTREGAEIPACAPPAAALTVNYAGGRPGSFFTLEGANLPPAGPVAITANGALLGEVAADPGGDLLFLLSTAQAGVGPYVVTAAAQAGASARFSLGLGKPLRAQEGEGPILDLPGGLVAYGYLPLVCR